MKNTLDTWYKNNLTSYASYIADETFCNDKSIVNGTGYKIDSYTYYGPYNRLVTKKLPSLKCSLNNGKFMVSNTIAKLDYPISLITADEMALAGGVLDINNSNYYLYNGQYYWTISPSYFDSYASTMLSWIVRPSGSISRWVRVDYSYGIRPVINLCSDVQITKGDGTALNPYVVQS